MSATDTITFAIGPAETLGDLRAHARNVLHDLLGDDIDVLPDYDLHIEPSDEGHLHGWFAQVTAKIARVA